jgi:membrane associated rhomboid family serine protease
MTVEMLMQDRRMLLASLVVAAAGAGALAASWLLWQATRRSIVWAMAAGALGALAALAGAVCIAWLITHHVYGG